MRPGQSGGSVCRAQARQQCQVRVGCLRAASGPIGVPLKRTFREVWKSCSLEAPLPERATKVLGRGARGSELGGLLLFSG